MRKCGGKEEQDPHQGTKMRCKTAKATLKEALECHVKEFRLTFKSLDVKEG